MKKRSSPEEFVELWQNAKSEVEVAEKLGVTRQAVNQRAYIFRKHGVPLRKFQAKPKVDWKALAKLAKKQGR